MKIFASIVSLLFLTQLAVGSLHPDPTHFALEGEVLFLSPTAETTGFAREETFSGNTAREHVRENDPRYRTGWRLAGAWAFDCLHDFSLRYTQFYSGRYNRTITGALITPIGVFVGDATSRVNYKYNAVDALLGTWICDLQDFDLNFGAGLHYASIRHFDERLYTPGSTSLILPGRHELRNRFWGIGPELSFDFHYLFSSCLVGNFALTGYGKGSMLIGRTQFEQRNLTIPTDVLFIFETDPFWSVTPAADFRLGLQWEYSCACLRGAVEGGYEWIWYRRTYRHRSSGLGTGEGFSDATFHGPYLSIGIVF
jgi:hypothetical protein